MLLEVVVVGGVSLPLPKLLLPLLPASPMVMVQCTGEGDTEEEEGGADEDGGTNSSSSTVSFIGSSSSSGWLLASQPIVMAVISFFWSGISLSQRALARKESMVGVVQQGIGG